MRLSISLKFEAMLRNKVVRLSISLEFEDMFRDWRCEMLKIHLKMNISQEVKDMLKLEIS